ncbi:MAG: discoidin domain-containing protein, partial [Oscillospiraceae bacterium]|nr:discoidin domain-containing protein [Oscillospiraceae bacterium]
TADYLWNPKQYEPYSSFESAIKLLHPDTYTSLSRVLPMLWANVINNNIDSADYKNLANKVITSANSGNLDIKACEELRTKLAELTADTELIKQDENKNFVQEITPWLNKFKSYSLMFDKLLNTAEEADSNKAQKLYDEYLQLKSEANENTAVVSRKVIAPVFNAVQRYIVSKNGYTPEITIKTNLKTHENYNLENAVDGDRLTFFWGYNEEANSTYNEKINILTGDYVEVDLGRPKSVTEIEILADDNWRTNYLHNAILQYSVDGKTFTNIGGSFTEPEIKLTELNITARYIRYTSTMQQDQWLILREFTVKTA